MARYILIDAATGYIFGDTADRWWKMDEEAPVGPLESVMSLDCALMLDNSGWSYGIVSRDDARATYHVFRADIDGSEVVPVVWDGQDQSTIKTVLKCCDYVASVERSYDS